MARFTVQFTEGGAQGPRGATGPSGGPVGPQGPTGVAGPSGPQGIQGPEGPQGLPGPVGATGAQGPIGPSGPRGIDGINGADGADGAQGPIGPTGLSGADGINGTDGADGAQGPIGPSGPQGLAGPTGPQGIQGPIGPAGADGEAGADGASGPQGSQGIQGPIGPSGPAGADGAQGPAGTTGPQGPIGPSGPQGPAGADGADGAQGAAGLSVVSANTRVLLASATAPASASGGFYTYFFSTTTPDFSTYLQHGDTQSEITYQDALPEMAMFWFEVTLASDSSVVASGWLPLWDFTDTTRTVTIAGTEHAFAIDRQSANGDEPALRVTWATAPSVSTVVHLYAVVAGDSPVSVVRSTTVSTVSGAGSIADAAASINTSNKSLGDLVTHISGSSATMYVASGTSSTAVWLGIGGTSNITPGSV